MPLCNFKVRDVRSRPRIICKMSILVGWDSTSNGLKIQEDSIKIPKGKSGSKIRKEVEVLQEREVGAKKRSISEDHPLMKEELLLNINRIRRPSKHLSLNVPEIRKCIGDWPSIGRKRLNQSNQYRKWSFRLVRPSDPIQSSQLYQAYQKISFYLIPVTPLPLFVSLAPFHLLVVLSSRPCRDHEEQTCGCMPFCLLPSCLTWWFSCTFWSFPYGCNSHRSAISSCTCSQISWANPSLASPPPPYHRAQWHQQ